ncbi:MAG: MarR family transcriptional regulator [Pseudomonadota bacterium]
MAHQDPAEETSETAESYRLADQIGFKLRLAYQRHLEVFNQLMPEVTPTQFAILATLLEGGPVSQNQLGRQVGLDAATTKGVIDRLHRKGLVDRTPSVTDLRRILISLTEKGQAFAQDAIPIASEVSRKTLATLSKREAERLLQLLDQL